MTKYRTLQRSMIQELFSEHPHEMFSAKEIRGLLGDETVSLSAIYRNLAELERSGQVLRLAKSGAREAYYRYTGTQACRGRIHLTCKKCGRTFHMKQEDAEALVQSARKYRDFSVDLTDTVLIGICGDCSDTH